jgi:hypothetical protein
MSPPSRTIRVVAAVVENNAKYLITRRRASAVLPASTWRGDRVAEGTRLLSGRGAKLRRGFESRPLRRFS